MRDKPEIRIGSTVTVAEPHLRPWEGTVLSIKPNVRRDTWYVDVLRPDGFGFAIQAEYVREV
jgi:hypothetical protein